ncbi:ATP-binding protein [Streptomyces cadmiisoli]|uniref:histidine kinase n=1 Tax=Streptomyces cadmiisoli TaxID=2184053 RepID=A0A2Z4IVX7_9ACTN|nr:ATP-binding protein [Streptomyces cadmiisoli]
MARRATPDEGGPVSTNERGEAAARGGVRGFTDRWPFRRKLNVLVGVPLAGLGLLLSYLISDQVMQARSAAEAATLVRDSTQVAELVDRVETEHQQAILLSVRYEARETGAQPSPAAYRQAQKAVDAQVRKVRATFGDRLPDTEAQALREISGLGSLRRTIEEGYLPADNIDPAYTNAAKGLIDGLGLDRNAALAATFTGNLLDSLLRADAAHSSFETSVFSATTGDSNALIEFIGAVGAYELYTHQAERFSRFATEEQAAALRGIEHSGAQATILRQYAELQIDPSTLQAGSPAEIRERFTEALASYPAYREQSESRLRITASLIDRIADRADDASNEAWWNAAWLLAVALVGFLVWGAFSVVVRRSVVRPVQALTGAARQVADVAGRELDRVADDDAEDDAPPRLREIPVGAKDEIGELAEAFNHVQTTAAALLERQVLSRRNVAEMFGNVGRRVSNLTTRQLALIDAVERGETDPALLERLYSIDHIAVRLRRNADSLMLLAGIRETVLDSGPTALTNVVRAALGQIEGYQRVELHAGTEIMVEPDIVGDLTLMVAELLENAVSFSPAGSSVEVTVHTGDAGAAITVADHGLGMSAERLAEENARLVRRERLDLVPTKVLGLFVVGNLARRWEIGVTLSRTPGGGVTAEVSIPSSLLLTMSALEPGLPQPPAIPAASGTDSGPLPATTTGGDRTRPNRTVPAPTDRTAADAAAAATSSAGVPSADTTSQDAASAGAPRPGHDRREDDAASLPRRVPRRETAGGDRAPLIPKARSEEAPGATGPDGTAPGGSRPLRRRVRGATLRTPAEADRQAARPTAAPADAEAVRSALEEFEAAVARAHHDSDRDTSRDSDRDSTRAGGSPALGTAPEPSDSHDQDLPEGAEQ